MTTKRFNWNFTAAHDLGESHVREAQRPDRPMPRAAKRIHEERNLGDASILLANRHA